MSAVRLANRADLRAACWRTLTYGANPPEVVDAYLRLLAALDAEEAGDPVGASLVAECLTAYVVETDGPFLWLRRCRVEAAP